MLNRNGNSITSSDDGGFRGGLTKSSLSMLSTYSFDSDFWAELQGLDLADDDTVNLLKTIFPDDIGMSDQVAGIGKQDSNFLDFAIYHIQQNKAAQAGLPGTQFGFMAPETPASMAMRGELAWHDDLREGLDTYDEKLLAATNGIPASDSDKIIESLGIIAQHGRGEVDEINPDEYHLLPGELGHAIIEATRTEAGKTILQLMIQRKLFLAQREFFAENPDPLDTSFKSDATQSSFN